MNLTAPFLALTLAYLSVYGETDPPSPLILDNDAERIVAPQEAIGRSVLEQIEAVIALQLPVSSSFSSNILSRVSRFKDVLRGPKPQVVPALLRIHARVQGCQSVATYDLNDLAKTSLLVLHFFVEMNRYADILSLDRVRFELNFEL